MSVGGTMLADADLRHEGGADRAVVEVAVGVLIRSTGDFLLTSRPKGKVYAGFWEFPGAKLRQAKALNRPCTVNCWKNLESRLSNRFVGGNNWLTIRMRWCA